MLMLMPRQCNMLKIMSYITVANGCSTPQEGPIALINEQLLNQGFAAVKRPDRKSPEAKHVVKCLGRYGCACREQDVSFSDKGDAAVESIADWMGGRIVQPQCFSRFPFIWKEGGTSSNRECQWNPRAVCPNSASLYLFRQRMEINVQAGQPQSSIYYGQCNMQAAGVPGPPMQGTTGQTAARHNRMANVDMPWFQ